MKVNYDKLWKLLIDKKMKKTDLIGQANISSNVLARMGREEPVSLESIGKICSVFECKIDDILEFDVEDYMLEAKNIKGDKFERVVSYFVYYHCKNPNFGKYPIFFIEKKENI